MTCRLKRLIRFGFGIASCLSVLLSPKSGVAAPKSIKRPLKVAAVYDVSNRKLIVKESLNGVELAVRDLVAKGNDVELKTFDSSPSSEGIEKAFNEVVKFGPDVTIAETDSSRAFIAGEFAEKRGLLMITPTATATRVTDKRVWVFRSNINQQIESTTLASFSVNELKAKRAAILFDPSQVYSSDLAQKFSDEFTKLGGTIALKEGVLLSDMTFLPAIQKVRAAQADLLVLPVYEELVAKIVSETIRNGGFGNTSLLGGNGWATAEIFDELVLSKSIGSLTAYWFQHFNCQTITEDMKAFAAHYKEVYGGKPKTQGSLLGYDTVNLAFRAFKTAGPRATKEQMRDTLRGLNTFSGLSGKFLFSGHQDPQKSLFMQGIVKGKPNYCRKLDGRNP